MILAAVPSGLFSPFLVIPCFESVLQLTSFNLNPVVLCWESRNLDPYSGSESMPGPSQLQKSSDEALSIDGHSESTPSDCWRDPTERWARSQ